MKLHISSLLLVLALTATSVHHVSADDRDDGESPGNSNGNLRGNGKLRKAVQGKIRHSYTVVFNDVTDSDEDLSEKAQKFLKKTGGTMKDALGIINGFSAQMTEGQAIAMSNQNDVEFVEEDSEVYADAVESWGLDRIDQVDPPLDNTYDSGYTGNGAGAVVYVIDTGIRVSHEQFAPSGRTFTSADYDFIGGGQNGEDCHGHGTHCSGTVAGTTVGVAPSANVIGVRVLGCTGSGSSTGVQAGINKVAEDCGPDGVAKTGTPFEGKRCIASMSLGGGFNSASNAAVDNLRNNNVIVAVAAGNDSADACSYSPASAPSAFTVGSTTSADAKSGFSNYGTCVNIWAPGSGIKSAVHGSDTDYATWSGTSMATPHVAGVAALILGADPSLTAFQAETKMLQDAGIDKIFGLGGTDTNKLLYVMGTCATNSQCNDPSNPCQTGTCNTGTGQCVVTNNNGAPCDDGDVCTITACSAGVCVVTGGNQGVLCDDEDGNECTEGHCDSSGQCVATPRGGEICDLGGCYENEVCNGAGTCAGDPICFQWSLETTMAGGNGQAGNMFDITAKTDVSINGFKIHCDTNANVIAHVYTKPGTYVGFETSSAAWTQVTAGLTVPCLGPGQKTPVAVDPPVDIAATFTQAFYVTLETANIDYTNGISAGSIHSQDPHIEFKEGCGKSYPFGSTYVPRIFNGEIDYGLPTATAPPTTAPPTTPPPPTPQPTTAPPTTPQPTTPQPTTAPPTTPQPTTPQPTTAPPTTAPPTTAPPTTPPPPTPPPTTPPPVDCAPYSCGSGSCDKSACQNLIECSWSGSPHSGSCNPVGGGGGTCDRGTGDLCTDSYQCCDGKCKGNGRCS